MSLELSLSNPSFDNLVLNANRFFQKDEKGRVSFFEDLFNPKSNPVFMLNSLICVNNIMIETNTDNIYGFEMIKDHFRRDFDIFGKIITTIGVNDNIAFYRVLSKTADNYVINSCTDPNKILLDTSLVFSERMFFRSLRENYPNTESSILKDDSSVSNSGFGVLALSSRSKDLVFKLDDSVLNFIPLYNDFRLASPDVSDSSSDSFCRTFFGMGSDEFRTRVSVGLMKDVYNEMILRGLDEHVKGLGYDKKVVSAARRCLIDSDFSVDDFIKKAAADYNLNLVKNNIEKLVFLDSKRVDASEFVYEFFAYTNNSEGPSTALNRIRRSYINFNEDSAKLDFINLLVCNPDGFPLRFNYLPYNLRKVGSNCSNLEMLVEDSKGFSYDLAKLFMRAELPFINVFRILTDPENHLYLNEHEGIDNIKKAFKHVFGKVCLSRYVGSELEGLASNDCLINNWVDTFNSWFKNYHTVYGLIKNGAERDVHVEVSGGKVINGVRGVFDSFDEVYLGGSKPESAGLDVLFKALKEVNDDLVEELTPMSLPFTARALADGSFMKSFLHVKLESNPEYQQFIPFDAKEYKVFDPHFFVQTNQSADGMPVVLVDRKNSRLRKVKGKGESGIKQVDSLFTPSTDVLNFPVMPMVQLAYYERINSVVVSILDALKKNFSIIGSDQEQRKRYINLMELGLSTLYDENDPLKDLSLDDKLNNLHKPVEAIIENYINNRTSLWSLYPKKNNDNDNGDNGMNDDQMIRLGISAADRAEWYTKWVVEQMKAQSGQENEVGFDSGSAAITYTLVAPLLISTYRTKDANGNIIGPGAGDIDPQAGMHLLKVLTGITSRDNHGRYSGLMQLASIFGLAARPEVFNTALNFAGDWYAPNYYQDPNGGGGVVPPGWNGFNKLPDDAKNIFCDSVGPVEVNDYLAGHAGMDRKIQTVFRGLTQLMFDNNERRFVGDSKRQSDPLLDLINGTYRRKDS